MAASCSRLPVAASTRPQLAARARPVGPAGASWAGRALSAPRRAPAAARCRRSRAGVGCAATAAAPAAKELTPVVQEIAAFAPATVANLGPGFDFMGCAVEGQGDTVTARVLKDQPGKVIIESIEGDGGRLSLVAEDNCAGIAAAETLKLLGVHSVGVALKLHKGLPLGSGLGSSAASAAAAAWAVNALFGEPLTRAQLVPAGLISEAAVSGYHADNVAPALMGGFVLVRAYQPALLLQQLSFGSGAAAGAANAGSNGGSGSDLWFVLVTPEFEAPTKAMRAALPAQVPFRSMLANCSAAAQLVLGIVQGDVAMLGGALGADVIIEAARAPLIPGMVEVKAAAAAAGAFGCTISGAGPTAVAIVSSAESGRKVAAAMQAAFKSAGGLETNRALVARLCADGARVCAPGADPLRHSHVINLK